MKVLKCVHYFYSIIVECADGSYGDRCSFDCSKRQCKDNTAGCSHVDGSCGGECQENYHGTDCTGIPEQEYIIRSFLKIVTNLIHRT